MFQNTSFWAESLVFEEERRKTQSKLSREKKKLKKINNSVSFIAFFPQDLLVTKVQAVSGVMYFKSQTS